MSSAIRHPPSPFPATRLRRTRQAAWVREMVAETRLHVSDLVLPLFIHDGADSVAVKSLPGVSRLTLSGLVEVSREAAGLGIPAVAIFPVIDGRLKDERGTEAFNADNLVCRAIRAVKDAVPELGVITDVALDPFTSHGQDGLMEKGRIINDATVEALAAQALNQAVAGCDIVAPSDMMDGRIGVIRAALESAGHTDTLILSYAAKYASSLYGPFRDAVDSARHLGAADKRTYQMDWRNADEALREVALDVAEGADMVMVKPALPYLDIVARVREHFSLPVLAYQVSGEYAMIKAAEAGGMMDGTAVMMECLSAIKRAGACGIFTYAAREVAQQLAKK